MISIYWRSQAGNQGTCYKTIFWSGYAYIDEINGLIEYYPYF